jgi:hypothetical protein
MVNIIGYEEVVVGNEVVQQPIYDEPIIVVGSGDDQTIMSLEEYQEQEAAVLAEEQ